MKIMAAILGTVAAIMAARAVWIWTEDEAAVLVFAALATCVGALICVDTGNPDAG